MIITLYTYTVEANAPYHYKLCIKSPAYNMVFQTNYYHELYYLVQSLKIDLSIADKVSTKHHYNYYGTLECTQKIHYYEGR